MCRLLLEICYTCLKIGGESKQTLLTIYQIDVSFQTIQIFSVSFFKPRARDALSRTEYLESRYFSPHGLISENFSILPKMCQITILSLSILKKKKDRDVVHVLEDVDKMNYFLRLSLL